MLLDVCIVCTKPTKVTFLSLVNTDSLLYLAKEKKMDCGVSIKCENCASSFSQWTQMQCETTEVSHSSWKSCPHFLPHLLLCSSTHVNELCILIDSQLKLEDGHLFFRENKQGKLHTVRACSRSMNSSSSVSLAWGMELHFYRSDSDLLQSLRRCDGANASQSFCAVAGCYGGPLKAGLRVGYPSVRCTQGYWSPCPAVVERRGVARIGGRAYTAVEKFGPTDSFLH